MDQFGIYVLAGVLLIAGLIILGNAQWLTFKGDESASDEHGENEVAVKSVAGSIVLLIVIAVAGAYFVKGLTMLSGA